jgi:MerR family redox-sensitive transcriptional activator SoxR
MVWTLPLKVDFKARGFLKILLSVLDGNQEWDHLWLRMPQVAISEVARPVGLRPSAIRYYEQIGVLPSAQRTNGQRRYDTAALYRLAVIKRARQTGFTLTEIRELFFGFERGTRAPTRWQRLSQRKLLELEAVIARTKAMQRLLIRLQDRCRCDTLDECGKALLKLENASIRMNSLPTRSSSAAAQRKI